MTTKQADLKIKLSKLPPTEIENYQQLQEK